ncbi:MAG: hypothetical protein M0038_17140 [Pseudomonadota bacterium]|jgi:hypothetical protein|nr:hypothetical protein [Pseudomonadota bacterium]
MQQSTPNYSVPSAPSAEQLAIANMAQFAGQPNSLASILANINGLTTPTKSPQSPSINVLLGMPPSVTTDAARGTVPTAGGAAAGAAAQNPLSTIEQYAGAAKTLANAVQNFTGTALSALGKQAYNTLSNALAPGAAATLASTPTMAPISTSAVGNAANLADASAAQELAAAGYGAGGAASAAGITPLLASQLTPISTNAVTAAANEAGSSAAQELAAAGYGSGANAAGAGAGAAAGAGGGAGALADASTALGALGAGYSAYNTIKNWQSGNTGSDALNGAETGASVGTMVAPGLGTLLGGLIGGAAGAVSSAFGGGKNDPETLYWNNLVGAQAKDPTTNLMATLNPSQAYESLAGIMDAKNNTPGHSTPLELAFGRMGEGKLMDQMTTQINNAIASGAISKTASPSQLYSQIVQPWLQSQNAYVSPTDIVSSNGTRAGNSINDLLTQLIGQWQSGALTSSSKVGIAGQTIAGLPNFLGASTPATSVAAAPQTTMSPMAALMLHGRGVLR